MLRTFRAEKMIKRVMEEGNEWLLDVETIALIKRLDGKTGTDYNYRSFVYDEPLVWIDTDEGGTYVALIDCD